MDIVFKPGFFYALQFILLAMAVITIFSLTKQDKRSVRMKEEEAKRDRERISELEAVLVGKERDHKVDLEQLDSAANDKEQELENRIAALESRLQEVERLKSGIVQLESEMKKKEELLVKESSLISGLNEKIKSSAEEAVKLKDELSLSNQMYEGLKGQYGELEEKFSQLFQQFLEEQKKNKLLEQRPDTSPPNGNIIPPPTKEQS
jgi:chromosome segregation ATPase